MLRTFGLALQTRAAGTRHDAASKVYFHRRGSIEFIMSIYRLDPRYLKYHCQTGNLLNASISEYMHLPSYGLCLGKDSHAA